jgi:hypothetical protein
MKFFIKKLYFGSVILLIAGFLSIYFFDRALFLGLLMVVLLSALTFFIFYKLKLANKDLYLLFSIVLSIHLAMALIIYYANFQPFGGGDFILYQQIAEQVSERIHQGIFSLDGINYLHYYPVLIGIIYSFTMPKMIIGQLLSVWLAAFSVLLIYLITIEIGGSKKTAFLVGLMAAAYPSYIYFGSLMLKDTVVMPLVLLGILVSIKMLKNFSALKFLAFFVILTCTIHLRFYVGFALMFSFIICWFLISNLKMTERAVYGLAFVFLLGTSPQILGYGYYGSTPLIGYLNKETITAYREVVYAPAPEPAKEDPAKVVVVAVNEQNSPTSPSDTDKLHEESETLSGVGSSFVVKAGFESPFSFVKNYLESFINAFLGPFPWQLRYKRHLFFLLETIPWYFFLCIVLLGAYKSIMKHGFLEMLYSRRFILPLLLFAAMAIGALSLFINNFGIIVRIRMPVLILFFSLIILNESAEGMLSKIFEKIFHYEKKVIKFFNLSRLQGRI